MKYLFFILCLCIFSVSFCQKDSLQLGDKYADDQLYLSISYNQFFNQPTLISKSRFSYGISAGFIKDIILNRQGNISIAAGIGYGYDYFNHQLKIVDTNGLISFSNETTISENIFKSHNLEFPLELRWRTSTANKYSFWRVYGGFKAFYNLSHNFQYIDANAMFFNFSNISFYNKFQYGLTLSAGYDAFNINIYYGLSAVFKNATIQSEMMNTKILKFGFIYYFL